VWVKAACTMKASLQRRRRPDVGKIREVEHFKELYARMYKAALPDEEALEIFNIQIIPGYFVWNEYYACFRK